MKTVCWLAAACSRPFVLAGIFGLLACCRLALSRSAGFNPGVVAGQVKDLDVGAVFSQLSLPRLAVMHAPVV